MPASGFFQKIGDKGKAGLDAIKSLRRKRTPSTSRAPSSCGSTASFTDLAVSSPSVEDASTGATHTNSNNSTAPPSVSTTETSGAYCLARLTSDPTIVALPIALGPPANQTTPQISISEPEQENSKWFCKI